MKYNYLLNASKIASKVVATDINPYAIKYAQANTRLMR
jgi:tRNA G37 N-methylase Trm5